MAPVRLILAIACGAAVPLVSACAPTQGRAPGAEALKPKQLALLDKQLSDKIAEAPVKCVQNSNVMDTIRVSDSILLYRQSGRLVYRNDLRNSCPGLARDSDIMVVEQFGSQTCSGDFFHLVDRTSGMRGATCVFGEFTPYRKPAGDGG